MPYKAIKVFIFSSAYESIVEEFYKHHPLETGGVLLGYKQDSESSITITHAIGPGEQANHKRFSFLPDAHWQNDEIARIYAETGRAIEYLGDWHSHPNGDGCLSDTDISTLKRISRFKKARQNEPIMGIIYGRNEMMKLSIHLYKRDKNRILKRETILPVSWEIVED